MTLRSIATSVLLALTLAACSERHGVHTAAPAPALPAPGAASAGDPLTPGVGNGGYHVRHYDLDLRITPHASPELAGTATITADATQALSRFDLDLAGLTVSKVTVDGAPASYTRRPGKLVIIPPRPLVRRRFTVSVAYSGDPAGINDPVIGRYGWISTHDGVFTGDEPSGAHTWFPGNDQPADKATFGFRVTVPRGLTVVANGELTGTDRSGNTTTYAWRERNPMATYLAMVDVGRFTIRRGRTPAGIPVYVAVDPSSAPNGPDDLYEKTVKITDEWTRLFGPYPFSSTGGVIDDAPVKFALETQTRPEYVASMAAVPTVVAHELSHEWFGDSVTVTRWSDLWLNEGFATYAEWMWGERENGVSVQRLFDDRYSQKGNGALWNVAPAAPGRGTLFGRSVYERGAMTLHALREKVGDRTFFAILRAWTTEHRHGSGTTAQFIALAERVSGRDLHLMFQKWLYDRGRPTRW